MNWAVFIFLPDNFKSILYEEEIKKHISSQFDSTSTFDVKFYSFSFKDKKQSLYNVLDETKYFDRVIVLCHEKLYKQLNFNDDLSIAFYIKIFDTELLKNRVEYFSFVIKCVLNLHQIDRFIECNNLSKIFRLPIFNFRSDILNSVLNSFLDVKNIVNLDVVKQLGGINKKPRKNSKSKFFVDERDFYFELGNERHGNVELKPERGHKKECYFKSVFRFGIALSETERHFNVMRANRQQIDAELICCHREKERRKSTHFNIFSNDFIR